ncbi:MAG TPA: hypothetical protein VGR54_02505 [Nitrosopumilaceae archaeon]|nr:hypothetical protein [Nitrosopumilaceae archaeon]
MSIIYTEAETQYRIYLIRYGGICKSGSSCGGFPIVDPLLIVLGIVLICVGVYILISLMKKTKRRQE